MSHTFLVVGWYPNFSPKSRYNLFELFYGDIQLVNFAIRCRSAIIGVGAQTPMFIDSANHAPYRLMHYSSVLVPFFGPGHDLKGIYT